MPRKFKITFAGCSQPQSKPCINDLSFIATSSTTVRVIGAGSLGAKPELGIVLYEQLSVNDIIPLVLGAMELFKEHADRLEHWNAIFVGKRINTYPQNLNCPMDEQIFRKSQQFKQLEGILIRAMRCSWHRLPKMLMHNCVSIFITALTFMLSRPLIYRRN